MSRRLAVLLALAPLIAAGCADDTSTPDAADEPAPAPAAERTTPPEPEPEPEPTALDITHPGDGDDVRRGRVTLTGTSEPGAKVNVDGVPATVASDGDWRRRVTLHLGRQTFDVTAIADGRERTRDDVTVTRRRSAAERRALRARRAAARARREANYKASAKAIPYNQLNKDADRYAGERVVYRGQILQIQEDEGLGGFMLLQVTDLGYGLWNDPVWVDYERSIRSAEDDVVTVYGTVTGSKSYETQIGGETYVPQIRARYVEE
jgi:hypothetical protein